MKMTTSHPLAGRLLQGNFSRDACLAAIHGESVPQALGHPLHQKCLIRGIRYHSGFAGEVYDLLPIFTRALNARMIMDDKIPESLIHKPYCIWHPMTASEDTYRQLAQCHPEMRYAVGRACAVAGYLTLYQELGLFPDVHIAEEARECGHLEIYQLIVSRLVRYSIMNDYERSIDETNLKPENLNGDTAVLWTLDIKQEFKDSADYDIEKQSYKTYLGSGHKELDFDITEDMNIDEFSSGEEHELGTRLEIRLLSQPLPVDLPTVQKDMLILMAAYLGDIDRYVRLRRPKMHPLERRCCIRGIYHSTFFAVWWSDQDPDYDLSAAINARMIMNNMLAGAPYEHVPYLIWWPRTAYESTYRELARLQPRMMHQIVHACIYAGYRDLFDELLPRISPEPALEIEADYQKDPYYKKALLSSRQANQDPLGCSWKTRIREVMRASSTCVGKYLTPSVFGHMLDGAYNGIYCDASEVELVACLPDDWHVPAEATSFIYRDLDYKQWPYGPEIITDP